MGSWAEGCCISNLEIAPNDDIVICFIKKTRYEDLNSGAFGLYAPITPLLRGKYDDYGGCDVEDTPLNIALFAKALERHKPDYKADVDDLSNINGDLTPVGCDFWMARADAFDMLRTVRPEFVMDEKIKRIADGEAESVEKMLAALPKLVELKELDALLAESRKKRREAEALKNDEEIVPDELVLSVRTSTGGYGGGPKIVTEDGREIVGHGCATVGAAESYAARFSGKVIYDGELAKLKVASKNHFSEEHMRAYSLSTGVFDHQFSADVPACEFLALAIYDAEDDEMRELCIRHIAELRTLQWGLGELRKTLHPLFRTGPQYDGWEAVEDYVVYLKDRIKARKLKQAATRKEQSIFMRDYNEAKKAFKKTNGRDPDHNEMSVSIKKVRLARKEANA